MKAPPAELSLPPLTELLATDGTKACCAAVYGHPAVRWLLGEELHPGGEQTTLDALELAGIGSGQRLLDVASGSGASAMLAAERLGCEVVGLEFGEAAVAEANAAAAERGLAGRVRFVAGDAEALPFEDGSFDAVLCECSLCTFPEKRQAAAEMRRVLRDGSRLALSDVTVERERLPAELAGPLAIIACVGDALSSDGYRALLEQAGFEVTAGSKCREGTLAMAERVRDRLRGARLLGLERIEGSPLVTSEAIELAGLARDAITEGVLGYEIIAARAVAPERSVA